MNKASGGDGIPAELFQILKDDAVKVLHSICQQIWKTQQWPQDGKRSIFIPILKKGKAKECSNYCTIALISHDNKIIFKILQARLQQHGNQEFPDVQAGFQMHKLDLEKAEEPEIKLPPFTGSSKKQESSRKTSTSASLTSRVECVDHNKLWNILKEMGLPDHLICLLRNLYAGQEATVRIGHETTDWFQIGKGIYIKAVYCHPAYLIYMQSTSCEMPGWMNHKLESRLPGEITTSDRQMIPL